MAAGIEAHGKTKVFTYDLNMRAVRLLLGEPAYTFVRDDSGVAVREWSCGCVSCGVESTERCSVQWCEVHGAQMEKLRML